MGAPWWWAAVWLINSSHVIHSSIVIESLRRTCEASGPGYVQVEVLGGVYEHVKIPVWLPSDREEEEKKPHPALTGYVNILLVAGIV